MSPADKLYYSLLALLASVSVLLGPFFYVRRRPVPGRRLSWPWALLFYLLAAALVWLVYRHYR